MLNLAVLKKCKLVKVIGWVSTELLNGIRNVCTSIKNAAISWWELKWYIKATTVVIGTVMMYYAPLVSLFVASTSIYYYGSHPVINEIVGTLFVVVFYLLLAYTSLVVFCFLVLSLGDLWKYFETKYNQE